MSDTQTALDMMTAAVTGRKEKAAAELTPVGTEKRGPLDGKRESAFPHDDADMAKQALLAALKTVAEAKQHLDFVTRDLEALGVAYGLSDNAPVAPVDAQKAREREADAAATARFEAEFAAKATAAQAATFAEVKAMDTPAPAEPVGWVCPKDGAVALVTLTSRSGRKYAACSICKDFEKR